ncbi:MAG TPA: hypothetical protein VIG06_29785 [Kofleriaceae bacterium]|jgi:hypothetical protein
MRAIAWGVLAVLSITPRVARAGGEDFVAAVSTARLAAPGPDSNLVHFGSGGSLSILWLEECRAGHLCGALESNALFLRGDGEARLYDLSAAITGSLSLEDNPVAPFLSVGLDLVSAAVPERDGAVSRGVGVGVHGNLGLHALLGERFYARGQLGYLGAAIGGVKGEVGIGYRFE